MAEHRPPNALIYILTAFLIAMTLSAATFWLLALVLPSGVQGVIAMAGSAIIALFASFHIPAAIVGILLLRWRRPTLRPAQRVVLEAATLYFGLAVLVSIFFNYFAASLLRVLQ